MGDTREESAAEDTHIGGDVGDEFGPIHDSHPVTDEIPGSEHQDADTGDDGEPNGRVYKLRVSHK